MQSTITLKRNLNIYFGLFLFLNFLGIQNTQAQTYVTWGQASSSGTLTGTFPGGTVTVTTSVTGNNVAFTSPAEMPQGNLVVTGNQTFSTWGPDASPPSQTTIFTFSTPVIVTRYNMEDIDEGSSWDDSFLFSGITFTSATNTDCIATTTGVISTADNAGFASWFTSTAAVSTFSINYLNTGGLTHAYLGYSLQVSPGTATPDVAVNNPNICPGGTAIVTATPSTPGNYSYVWTVPVGVPNPGNVSSFNTTIAGEYSVIMTNQATGISSPSASGTVTIGTNNVPVFTQLPPICAGSPVAALPLTSNNGITGTWSPVINNTATTTYTFTPTAGQCAVNSTMTITVNPDVLPTFTQVAPICAGAPLAPLPTISNNGVTGTWSPALDNTTTTTYTFTPGGACPNTTTMVVVVNPNVIPAFSQVAEICEGATLAALPMTSLNGIDGTWSPVINNTATTTYTFTPNAGQCAFNQSMTITVNPILIPSFNSVAPLCFGDSFTFPSISTNGVTGTWTPAFDNTATTLYTFTPDQGQCAIASTLTVPILDDFDYLITSGCENDHFIINLSAVDNTFEQNSATYTWQNSDNVTIGSDSPVLDLTNYINSTSVVETLPMSFTVTVTNSDGCEKVKPIVVDNMYCGIQQGISANADSMNDFFDLQLLNVSRLSIFNRYGLKVYTKANYLKEWTGETDGGQELPDGTYYYLIEFKNDSPVKSGWIYLNRKS